MKVLVFKKSLLNRLSAYMLILPFIPAIRPILNKHSTAELIVFISGFILTVLLILYSNNKAYIRITENNLLIHLIYRHKPEIHHLSSIEKIIQHSQRKLTLKTRGFDPLEIRLNKKEMVNFLEVMENREINISKVYRS